MGRLQVVLSDAVEQQLRELVEEEYSGKKGAISIVIEQAVKKLLKQKAQTT